jgi:hypothetical protein
MNKRNSNLVKTNMEQLAKEPQTRRYMVFDQVRMGRCLAAIFIKRAVES